MLLRVCLLVAIHTPPHRRVGNSATLKLKLMLKAFTLTKWRNNLGNRTA